jgi:hypothetical protein
LQEVLIDQSHVGVTHNLRHALTRLRQIRKDDENGKIEGRGGGEEEGDVILWVDALCINQEDISERSIQTSRMRAIYQNARKVAVWLGMEYSYSNGAIELARDLNSCTSVSEVENLLSCPERREQLEALVQLFRRQYWWRIWVIQEVSCARDATVYVGSEEIPWTELDGVCEVFRIVENSLRSLFYKNPSYVRTLTHGGPRSLQLSRYNPYAEAPPLLELLLTHKSKKATDPKDKVFALVGISSSRHTFGDIDYSKSMRQIYTHIVRHISSTSRKLDVICVKQHDVAQFNLPSWGPDWTRPKPGAGATVLGLHHHEPAFNAAGNKDVQVDFIETVENGENLYILRAKGITIDQITSAGIPYKKRGAPSDVAPAVQAFHDWWNLFSSTNPDPDSITNQARFARLISCGNWVFSTPETYVSKIEAIFALAEEKLSESAMSGIEPSGPLSRSGTVDQLSRSSTMASSTSSLMQDEDDELAGSDEEEKERLSAMITAGMTMNRRMFVTSTDIMGLGPWNAEEGDLVVVLFGCKFPVVLREISGSDGRKRVILIGESYVEGFMEGEAIASLRENKFSAEEFDIC